MERAQPVTHVGPRRHAAPAAAGARTSPTTSHSPARERSPVPDAAGVSRGRALRARSARRYGQRTNKSPWAEAVDARGPIAGTRATAPQPLRAERRWSAESGDWSRDAADRRGKGGAVEHSACGSLRALARVEESRCAVNAPSEPGRRTRPGSRGLRRRRRIRETANGRTRP